MEREPATEMGRAWAEQRHTRKLDVTPLLFRVEVMGGLLGLADRKKKATGLLPNNSRFTVFKWPNKNKMPFSNKNQCLYISRVQFNSYKAFVLNARLLKSLAEKEVHC